VGAALAVPAGSAGARTVASAWRTTAPLDGPVRRRTVEIMWADRSLRLTIIACICLIVTACSGSGSTGSHPAGPSASASRVTPAVSPSLPAAPYESQVRRIVPSGADRFGWVEASAKDILATYYPPGSGPFVGGRRVKLADRIIVIKMHGLFGHSAPPGGKSSATLALAFYDITTRQDLGFRQMWDGNAPDLGVGDDPGLVNREAAAQWWDLRLLGTPTVRAA